MIQAVSMDWLLRKHTGPEGGIWSRKMLREPEFLLFPLNSKLIGILLDWCSNSWHSKDAYIFKKYTLQNDQYNVLLLKFSLDYIIFIFVFYLKLLV